MTKKIIHAFLVTLVFATVSHAQAVGPNCKLSWIPPTTDTTGATLPPGTITAYRVYVDKLTITPNVTPPTLSVAGTVTSGVQICTPLAAGNHTVAVSAVAGPNEGAASVQLPFVLVTVTPALPSGLQVLP